MEPSSDSLVALGWDEGYQEQLASLEGDLEPGRVAVEHRGSYTVITATGEMPGEISGRVSFAATHRSDLPAVGDWVALARSYDMSLIQHVLPRRSAFVRKVAGTTTDDQVVAANVDVVFICSALDADLNLRRIERYLTLSWQSGAVPVVVLTKADLSDRVEEQLAAVQEIARGSQAVAVAAFEPGSLDVLRPFLGPGRTVALLGSSGVGKSTLVNVLLDRDEMVTRAIRWDGKGRHTTSHRQLIPLPEGGSLIDTPGMRELQLWDADEGLDATFDDIAELASGCRFRDCGHSSEPGCAVKAALEDGSLERSRFESWAKQERELAALARRKDHRLAKEETRRWKQLNREARARSRQR